MYMNKYLKKEKNPVILSLPDFGTHEQKKKRQKKSAKNTLVNKVISIMKL